MALKLSQHETEVSRWDLRQRELAPFAHWSHPRFGLFLLIVFAGNVVVATLVWLLVGLFMQTPRAMRPRSPAVIVPSVTISRSTS
jgi:hypothetical protein